MMNVNKKRCDGCGQQKPIWKNVVLDGIRNRLCKQCWSCQASNVISKPTKIKKPIAPRSKKRSKQERIYAGKRVIFMLEHPKCQANMPELCTKKATEVHHIAGRMGELLIDESLWMAVCRTCHEWIEGHPIEATDLGWRKSKTI